MSYRLKLLGFFVGAVGVLFVLNVAFSALNTLTRLTVVEAERDRWQRPSDVIQVLNLKPGDVVADVGCGSGYFTLKLSGQVGTSGRVVAEDIRWLPLAFLWLRMVSRRDGNVSVVLGGITDPHLPARVDAVLIANAYHEMTGSRLILAKVYESLVQGGRLVVVDREPDAASDAIAAPGAHEISAERVESEIRQAKLAIVSRNDHFISSDPARHSWWLIVARKP